MARNDTRLEKLENGATNAVSVSFVGTDDEGELVSITAGGETIMLEGYASRAEFEAAAKAAEASRGRVAVRIPERFVDL